MLKKLSKYALHALVTVIAFAATTGVGTYSWFTNYQPAAPKELR